MLLLASIWPCRLCPLALPWAGRWYMPCLLAAVCSLPPPLPQVMAYLFNGYWEDIGTIESFFNANLALTHNVRALLNLSPVVA